MPVIPITSRTDPRFADAPPDTQGMPSETNLLMALAEMHRQGRFQQLPKSTNIEDLRPSSSRQRKTRSDVLDAADQQARDANAASDYRQAHSPVQGALDLVRTLRGK